MRRPLLLLPLSLAVAALAGCGNKGPLVMPTAQPAATGTAAMPAAPATVSSSAAPVSSAPVSSSY